MTKEEYFNTKHQQIANQFGVKASTISFIRSFTLGTEKMTRAQLILWLEGKTKNTERTQKCKHCNGTGKVKKNQQVKVIYTQALDLIKKANESDWKDIIYEYKYQK